ncbi:MAG: AMP-binding protein, partial [Pannonibacter indicus]
PLALLFGEEALEYRLRDAGACVIVTNSFGLQRLKAIKARLPALQTVISVDGPGPDVIGFRSMIEGRSGLFDIVESGPDTPALMIYTSGTTGPPKGALHGHRVLAGHIPGFQLAHDYLPQPGDKIWTPSDWAWAGGLLNMLLPALHFGVAVVARPVTRFEPEDAYGLIQDLGIRNAFVP